MIFPRRSFLFLLLSSSLPAQTYIEMGGGRNHGELAMEGGSKYQGNGSRLTYGRNFNFGTLGAGYRTGAFDLAVQLRSTGWYVDPGGARDEDFRIDAASQERRVGLDHKSFSFRDSVNHWQGTRNFADARARSSMLDYAISIPVRYYGQDPAGWFALATLRYNYFDYFVYDVIQYIEGEDIHPIGAGLTFSMGSTEGALGGGYRFLRGPLGFDISLQLLAGKARARDFHIQRLLNFIVYDSFGTGLLYDLTLFFIGKGFEIRATAFGHRYYSSGLMVTRGGYTRTDIESNFLGPYRIAINTKEAGGLISVLFFAF
ncbi:MAG: putative porin [Spirochaetales bacterium]|nr:putative porin [Spirochaetales bacterium]